MRQTHLKFLTDPILKKPFALTVFAQRGDHVTAGLLVADSSWYPIIGGIPRILVGDLKVQLLQKHHAFFRSWRRKLPASVANEWKSAIGQIVDFDAFLRHQKKTAERFAFEWRTIYRENSFEKHNFLHFLSPFIAQRDLKGKTTLDIGCGSGRFTKWAALLGAKVAFGTDLGDSVEVAYELTRDLPNVCIVQADIYDMPFKGVFDIAYSIGVLHHLPNPQEGFSRLPSVLKPKATMLIWVYNRRGNARALYFYEPLRAVAKTIPAPVLLRLCYVPALAVHSINGVQKFLSKMGLKRAVARTPFFYYTNFPFNMKLNDAFDVLATPKSNYYTFEQVEQWFKKSRLKKVRSYEHPEAGITCVGQRHG